MQVGDNRDEDVAFTDTSWHNNLGSTNYREVIFDWRADAGSVGDRGVLSIQFEKDNGTLVRLLDVPYNGGAPDNLLLSLGWTWLKNVSLRLESLSIIDNDTID